MSLEIPRRTYADLYGPTTGDRVRLADTELIVEVEKDFAVPGDEITFTLLPSKIASSAGILYKAVASDGRVILEDKSRLRGDPTAQ